jgi:hypothetical protein
VHIKRYADTEIRLVIVLSKFFRETAESTEGAGISRFRGVSSRANRAYSVLGIDRYEAKCGNGVFLFGVGYDVVL